MKGRLVPLLLLAALLVSPAAAFANDTALGSIGGTVRPVAVSDIRLDAETVQLIAYQRFAEVRVDFRFVNEGPKRTVRLGFPFAQGNPESPFSPEAGFRAWKDGKPLEVATVKGTGSDAGLLYYVHEAEFDKGDSMVTVTYLASPTESSGGGTEFLPEVWAGFQGDVAAFDYWVHTGAGWKGRIRRSLVRFSFAEDFLGVALGRDTGHRSYLLSPKDVVRPDARTFLWDLRDYEPARRDDMCVPFVRPVPSYDKPEQMKRMPVVEVTASSRLKLDDQHEYLAEMGADGSPRTAWAEGVDGPGAGEWLKVRFGSARRVREIRVLPGYQKTAALFAKYNRPKTLKVTFSSGKVTMLHLADEMGVQRFPVDTTAGWAKAEIVDVYRGTTRDETYLTGIEFGSAPAPVFETFEEMMGEQLPAKSSSATASPVPADETSAKVMPVKAPKPAPGYPADPRSAYLAGASACLLLAAAIGAYLLMRRRA